MVAASAVGFAWHLPPRAPPGPDRDRGPHGRRLPAGRRHLLCLPARLARTALSLSQPRLGADYRRLGPVLFMRRLTGADTNHGHTPVTGITTTARTSCPHHDDAHPADHAPVYDGAHAHDHHHHDQPVSLRALVALGVSGGIIPCPAALVVLLSALSIHRSASASSSSSPLAWGWPRVGGHRHPDGLRPPADDPLPRGRPADPSLAAPDLLGGHDPARPGHRRPGVAPWIPR